MIMIMSSLVTYGLVNDYEYELIIINYFDLTVTDELLMLMISY